MKRMSIVLIAMMFATPARSGPVDVPNSFQGGARALASEVNANFSAVETAVDDNAVRIEALEIEAEAADIAIDDNTLAIGNNAENITALQAGLPGAGMQVRVAGEAVGRFLAHGFEPIEVDVSGGGGVETELVARRTVIGTADVVTVVSPTGYLFSLAASSFPELPFGPEGSLIPLLLWYASSDCTGQAYLAVEGPTGLFSTFEPGIGDSLPIKRWFARQGFVFRSPDPTAVGEAYMVPRNQLTQQVALGSLYLWSRAIDAVSCVDLALVPGHTGKEINSVMLVESLDPVETGVAADLSGEITVGL